MTVEEALQAVCDYVQACTGAANGFVLVGDADPLRTTSPYYMVRVIDDADANMPTVVYGLDGGDLVSQVHEQVTLAVQIDGFGVGSDDGLRACRRRWVAGRSEGDALRAAGVHPWRWSSLRDLSRLVQTSTEPRWTLTMDAYIGHADTAEAVDAVTEVVVDVTLERPDEVVASFTVTVEP